MKLKRVPENALSTVRAFSTVSVGGVVHEIHVYAVGSMEFGLSVNGSRDRVYLNRVCGDAQHAIELMTGRKVDGKDNVEIIVSFLRIVATSHIVVYVDDSEVKTYQPASNPEELNLD